MSDTEDRKEDRKPDGAEEFDSELVERDEVRAEDDRAEREDVTQGMATGTHDSVRRGVRWGSSYKTRPKKGQTTGGSAMKNNPQQSSEKQFKCGCGGTFATEAEYRDHMKTHAQGETRSGQPGPMKEERRDWEKTPEEKKHASGH